MGVCPALPLGYIQLPDSEDQRGEGSVRTLCRSG